jgi:secreted trypsin-like serine protease
MLMNKIVLKSIALSFGIAGALQNSNGCAQDDSPGGRRIVNGVRTTIQEHPWQVALNIDAPGDRTYLCGGSIISQRWIVTAAHCFETSAPDKVRAKAGVTNYAPSPPWLLIERVTVHESYNDRTHENDIALIRLQVPTSQLSIPLAGRATALTNTMLEVTGWGRTSEYGAPSAQLLKAEVPYVENATCNQLGSYNGSIKPTMMCAGEKEGGVDSCQGDSGGPLVLRASSGPILVGVVSFGEGCARKLKYGVYARVSEFREWIADTLRAP